MNIFLVTGYRNDPRNLGVENNCKLMVCCFHFGNTHHSWSWFYGSSSCWHHHSTVAPFQICIAMPEMQKLFRVARALFAYHLQCTMYRLHTTPWLKQNAHVLGLCRRRMQSIVLTWHTFSLHQIAIRATFGRETICRIDRRERAFNWNSVKPIKSYQGFSLPSVVTGRSGFFSVWWAFSRNIRRAFPAPLVVTSQPSPAAPFRFVKLRELMEPAAISSQKFNRF